MMFKNTWKLYEEICKFPDGIFLSKVTSQLNWSKRKVKRHAKKLHELIYASELCYCYPSLKKITDCFYIPKLIKELINWKGMNTKPEDYNFGEK